MDGEELKALSFVRRALLRKNENIRALSQRLKAVESQNELLKSYQWRCADLEEEVRVLQSSLSQYTEQEGDVKQAALETVRVSDDFLNENGSDSIPQNEDGCSLQAEEYSDNHTFHMEAESGAKQSECVDVIGENGSDYRDNEDLDSSTDQNVASEMDMLHPSTRNSGSCFPIVASLLTPSTVMKNSSVSNPSSTSSSLSSSLLHESSVPSHRAARGRRCPYCNKWCRDQWFLRNHVRTHTGERPFSCPHCPHTSSRKQDMKNHVIRRHRTDLAKHSA